MYDLLPFPDISAKTPEEQVSKLFHYLIQLKETLEFILTNISVDNLSQDLVRKLNSLGAEIQKNDENREDQINQIANKLTVSDVINSEAFRAALDREYRFAVNFTTGNLEYTKEM